MPYDWHRWVQVGRMKRCHPWHVPDMRTIHHTLQKLDVNNHHPYTYHSNSQARMDGPCSSTNLKSRVHSPYPIMACLMQLQITWNYYSQRYDYIRHMLLYSWDSSNWLDWNRVYPCVIQSDRLRHHRSFRQRLRWNRHWNRRRPCIVR